MVRWLLLLTWVCVVLGLAGCASDVEKLAEHCESLERTVQTVKDCEALGDALGELAKAHAEWQGQVRSMPEPAEGDREAWRLALEPCLRARLEAAAGPCRAEPGVETALRTMRGD